MLPRAARRRRWVDPAVGDVLRFRGVRRDPRDRLELRGHAHAKAHPRIFDIARLREHGTQQVGSLESDGEIVRAVVPADGKERRASWNVGRCSESEASLPVGHRAGDCVHHGRGDRCAVRVHAASLRRDDHTERRHLRGLHELRRPRGESVVRMIRHEHGTNAAHRSRARMPSRQWRRWK